MAFYIKLYLATLVAFFAIDMVWLGLVARTFYRKYLAFLMAPNPNWLAAIIFYLLFIVGILVFVVVPGLADDGNYPGNLSVAGASTCDQETLPYIWRNGSWLLRDTPLDLPGFAGWVTSVSNDHPEQPTHTLWAGDDFLSSAWVSTAGQPAAQLKPLSGDWEALTPEVSAEGNHIVGGLEHNSNYLMLRAVRWSREGDDWSEPEQLGAGLAVATTADGSVVVGNDYYGAFRPRPWVWTATPGCGDLVLLDQDSVAADMSHDGSRV